jgi:hypothetical protein
VRSAIITIVLLIAGALPAAADTAEVVENRPEAVVTTTTRARMVEVCIDEAIVEVAWEFDLDDQVITDQDRKHCLPKAPTSTIPTGGGSHVVFPADPGTGWVCVGSDKVIVEVPRDSGQLVPIRDTAEEAQADCPLEEEEEEEEEKIAIVLAAPVSTPTVEVLPFTGIDPLALFITALSALALGGLMVSPARSDI